MNKRHPYRDLEREYVTSDLSIRELCRRHGISAHSLVVVQAQKHDWAAKHEACRTRESEACIEKHAARQADRVAQIADKAIGVIDTATRRNQRWLTST